MEKIKKIIKYIQHPDEIMVFLASKNLIKMDDRRFLEKQFSFEMNYKLNLENPKTFNEKLQWLKLYDRKDVYTTMVDKYEVKTYVKNAIGEEYIIPTLGVYNKFDDINFEKLPEQFVLKCTHDSGGIIICKDKEKFNKEKARKKINRYLKKNFYYNFREWPYRNVKPRIIAEKFIGENLTDYRIYCFNSEPKYIYMYLNESINDMEKPEPKKCNIYNTEWILQDMHQKSLPTNEKYEKPEKLDEMLKISRELSKSTKFLRVDFYIINNHIKFGEMTFFPGAGLSKFYPEKYDQKLGELISLKGDKSEI